LPVLAFPSLNLEFLGWVGLVPGLLMLRAAPTAREAAVRGWWLGTGYLLMAMYWLTPNLGPAVLLIAIVLGLPWAGVGLATWYLLRGPRPARLADPTSPDPTGPDPTGPDPTGPDPANVTNQTSTISSTGPIKPDSQTSTISSTGPTNAATHTSSIAPAGPTVRQALAALAVLPSCWVVIDVIRSWQGIGGPWAVFGASQWQHPVVLALAAVGGIWLISFVLVAANTAIVIMLTAATLAGRAVGAAAALIAIAAGPTAFALTSADYAVPGAGHLTVALVQPGLESTPRQTVAQGVRLTTRAPHADLVVWGESSVGFDLRTSPRLLAELKRLSAAVRTPLLVSQDALNPAGAKSKVAVLLGPGGIEQTYTKTRLVPFGEYIPFRSALGWLSSISRAAPQNMVAGKGARVLHAVLADGRRLNFGVLICFESSFPDMSRFDTDHRAQVLIYQTSDSTFQGSWAPAQHASLAALRAAETGRPAVQAALTGDSAAFDARGRELAWAGTHYRGVLRVRLALPADSVRTPFDRLGDYVPWFAVAVVAMAAGSAIYATGLFRRFARG
jgi:apolipoprotein N-acyltransferase